MSSVSDDRPDADRAGGGADQTPPAAGDLEFDEAWGAAGGARADAGATGVVRDPDPSFEDPSER